MNFVLKTKDKRYETKKINRFLYYTRLIAAKTPFPAVSLRVTYGIGMDASGKHRIKIKNEGTYATAHDFLQAVKAFLER